MDQILAGVFSLSLSLFLLMDSIGNIPLYLVYLKDIPSKRQYFIIFRELVIALIVIILFTYLGEFLLSLLKISQPSLLISGGVILFLMALKMIFPPDVEVPKERKIKEPFIVPLAIPLVAGPAVLGAVMIYSKNISSHWTLLFAILLAWIASTIILLSSSLLKRCLGERGLAAFERLMGLILTLISVQMFLEGIGLFAKQLSS